MAKLNPRQKRFCDEYIKTGNYYQSAIAAGYSENYASRQDYLLDIVGVRTYLDNHMKKIAKPTIATAEEVLEYLTRVARGEEKEQEAVYNSNTGKVELVDVTPALRERTKAAELLGKRYAIFTDKKEIDVNVNKKLEDFFESDV